MTLVFFSGYIAYFSVVYRFFVSEYLVIIVPKFYYPKNKNFGKFLVLQYHSIRYIISACNAGNRSRALECHHFFNPFDLHNYCPTCREAGKGDDNCVTKKEK